MKIILPRLLDGEILALLAHCEAKVKQERFTSTPKWLSGILHEEIVRRSDESKEPAMIALPSWSDSELADALLFTYCLVNSGLTAGLAKFADELFQHVVGNVAAQLEYYGDRK